MTPIEVTAHLAEPLVWYGDGLHLDGLLGAAVAQEYEEAGDPLPPPDHSDWPDDIDLPLARWTAPLSGSCHARLLDESGELWGWSATDAHPDGPKVESSHALRRMIDVGDFVEHTDAARYKRSSGTLKPKDKTYPTLMVPRLRWRAEATDVERAADLLDRYISHLGKLRHHGMGRVQRWEVTEVDRFSLVADGATTRHLPASIVTTDQRPTRGAIRPPYWHPSRSVDNCHLSGTEVTDAVE